MTKIYLGEPPATDKVWIQEHFSPVKTFVKYTAASGLQPWNGLISGTMDKNSIPNASSAENVVIGRAVTQLSSGTFQSNTVLKNVTIPSTVTAIPATCFNLCTSLIEIAIPTEVTSIGQYAFDGCTNLCEVVLDYYNSQLKFIGPYAFNNCTSLYAMNLNGASHIYLPDSLTAIQDYAFYHCSNIEQVDMSENPSLVLGAHIFDSCTQLNDISMPSQLTAIPDGFCANCTLFHNINIPNSCQSIGEAAFMNTSILDDNTIDLKNVNYVGDYCFSGTNPSGYDNIVIMNKLTSAGRNAFANTGIPNTVCGSYKMQSLTTAQVVENADTWGIGIGYNASTDETYRYKVRVTCSDGIVVINGNSGS